MTDFGLYLVMTNPVVGYERCCEAAVKAGVGIVQLRMKDAPRGEILSVARALRAITAGTKTLFIVNDDPSIAAEAEADGVHVGQTDMPVAEVRSKYPTLGVVGKSTHSLEQAVAAMDERPDYIGVGPVWATPTKKIPDPTLGVAEAAKMMRLFKKIRDTKGTFHAKMGTRKDRNGMDLTEAEDIKKRWQEYTEELYKKLLRTQINTMVWSLT